MRENGVLPFNVNGAKGDVRKKNDHKTAVLRVTLFRPVSTIKYFFLLLTIWARCIRIILFYLQINYLGHFLLIGQLLSVMKNSDSDDARIVLVSSDMHRWPSVTFDLSQMNYSGEPEKYSMFTCYGRSKLYQVNL